MKNSDSDVIPENHKTCSVCKYIPDHEAVETLHTQERLPKQVHDLFIVGGYGLGGSEQIRKCSKCHTYYTFIHDHDSESGVGAGYTDEAINRITNEVALELIEKTIRSSRSAAKHWRQEYKKKKNTYSKLCMDQQSKELHRLLHERAILKKDACRR